MQSGAQGAEAEGVESPSGVTAWVDLVRTDALQARSSRGVALNHVLDTALAVVSVFDVLQERRNGNQRTDRTERHVHTSSSSPDLRRYLPGWLGA